MITWECMNKSVGITLRPLSCSVNAPPNFASDTPRTNFFNFLGKFMLMKFLRSSVAIPSEMEFAFVNASIADLNGLNAAKLLSMCKMLKASHYL